jgi:hypothetical protein
LVVLGDAIGGVADSYRGDAYILEQSFGQAVISMITVELRIHGVILAPFSHHGIVKFDLGVCANISII